MFDGSIDGPKLAVIVLAVLLPALAIGIYLIERRHGGRGHRRGREPERLPLFGTEQLSIRTQDGYSAEDEVSPMPVPASRPRAVEPAVPSPALRARPPRRQEPLAPAPAPASPPIVQQPVVAPAAPPMPPRPAPVGASAIGSMSTAEHPIAGRRSSPAATIPTNDAALIDGETLRFSVPADGTVEFLPGRLEVVAGPEAGREIRFARALDETDVEVTFGRSEGPANRHVQILARTVSRRHAVMTLIDEHWQLTNLSSTNPIVLNGRVLAGNEVAPLLVEGDRIEMGEVAFVFHDV